MYEVKKKVNYCLMSSLLLSSLSAFSHGVIESPASREQFCGVESKPDEIFRDKMTHEKCRPIMKNDSGAMDNSIYNFMAVLTHTIGRSDKSIDKLPPYVCGFGSEMWSGGKTPWDRANDWPTSTIKSGLGQFVWNISWGNHFGDTEEFVYWITKPNFKFDSTKELSWSDFEATPFCKLTYNDSTPNANPNIVPDKTNNKFTTTCTVPTRSGRAVIYGEWGRTKATYERFHSCMDVVFATDNTPPQQVSAQIADLPENIVGAAQVILDAGQSVGTNLTYNWSVNADDTSKYSIQNSTSAKAILTLGNVKAQQRVTVNLEVKQGTLSDHTSKQFNHLPAASTALWKNVGNALVATGLASGDKIQLRLIDGDGRDYFYPQQPLILTADTAQSANWAYALAQAVNNNNDYSAKIGVLSSDAKTVTPIKSATDNKLFVPIDSSVMNAYIMVEKKDIPSTGACKSQRRANSSSYWLGYDVYADKTPIILNFSETGIDLTQVKVDGVFTNIKVLDKNRLQIGSKPDWVTSKYAGYLGLTEKNSGRYDPFNSPISAVCTVNTIK